MVSIRIANTAVTNLTISENPNKQREIKDVVVSSTSPLPSQKSLILKGSLEYNNNQSLLSVGEVALRYDKSLVLGSEKSLPVKLSIPENPNTQGKIKDVVVSSTSPPPSHQSLILTGSLQYNNNQSLLSVGEVALRYDKSLVLGSEKSLPVKLSRTNNSKPITDNVIKLLKDPGMKEPSIANVERLAQALGIVTPLELKSLYTKSHSEHILRALHELGHSAVKSNEYRQYWGKIELTGNEKKDGKYKVRNDRVPDIAIMHDPTANEDIVQQYTNELIKFLGWEKFIPQNIRYSAGTHIYSPDLYSTVNVELDSLLAENEYNLQTLGIDFAEGKFVPPDIGLELPHPNAVTGEKVLDNINYLECTLKHPLGQGEKSLDNPYWLEYLLQRFCNKSPLKLSDKELKELKHRIVDFGKSIGIPEVIERGGGSEPQSHYETIRSMTHEAGHFAILDPTYTDIWKTLTNKPQELPEIQAAPGSVPLLPFPIQRTLDDNANRLWGHDVLKLLELPHPISIGEAKKAATARIWAGGSSCSGSLVDNLIKKQYIESGIDFSKSIYRPTKSPYSHLNPQLDGLSKEDFLTDIQNNLNLLPSQYDQEYWKAYQKYWLQTM